ncbi:MAG: transaldolase family protein [Desulfobulbus sp.]|nr:transaldolase family protein [Desulfobulbus sp.]
MTSYVADFDFRKPTMDVEIMNRENPLKRLGTLGQSIWLDYIRRDLIVSGELRRLIEEDGIRGMTSNPAIFEKAIAGSNDYDEDIRAQALLGKDIETIYASISQHDVQNAQMNSALSTTGPMAKTAMSAWRSIRIWRMIPRLLSRKPAGCGPH